jgi:hypothetical protein
MADKDNDESSSKNSNWGKRTLWFLLLWIGGVLTLGTISYGLKMLFKIAY